MKLEDAINRIAKNMLFLIINKIQFTSRDQNNLITMYGLPRLHKKNPPLRLIFAFFFSTLIHTTLQNFLVFILDPLTHNQFIVKKICFLSALLQTLQLEEPIHIAIFEITSLLTNTSLDKTSELIFNSFFINLRNLLLIRRRRLQKIFHLLCKDTHFILNSRIYKQHDGVAVGFLLNPILGNIFLCQYEQI